jgi:hypothetical protein
LALDNDKSHNNVVAAVNIMAIKDLVALGDWVLARIFAHVSQEEIEVS